MDAPHFDARTRRVPTGLSRRGGLGFLAILGLHQFVAPNPAAAKRKKKRCPPCKRRKKGKCRGALPDGSPCPGGACRSGSCRKGCLPADQCCADDECTLGLRCCDGVCTDELRAAGAACDDGDFCCSNYCQFERPGAASCAPTCRGKQCLLDRDCCRGFACTEVVAAANHFCGGCVDVGGSCEGNADCCFSDCTAVLGAPSKRCGSLPGGPCARSANCRSCNLGGDCVTPVAGVPREICRDGVCGCPDAYECCSNLDCPLDETCVFVWEGGELTGECRPLLPGR